MRVEYKTVKEKVQVSTVVEKNIPVYIASDLTEFEKQEDCFIYEEFFASGGVKLINPEGETVYWFYPTFNTTIPMLQKFFRVISPRSCEKWSYSSNTPALCGWKLEAQFYQNSADYRWVQESFEDMEDMIVQYEDYLKEINNSIRIKADEH